MGRTIHQDEHIGQRMLRIDIGNGGSPSVIAIVPPDVDGELLCRLLTDDIAEAVELRLGRLWEWSLGIPVKAECRSCDVIEPPEVREQKWTKVSDAIAGAFRRATEKHEAAMAADPHNGTLGWWRVEGVRHSAMVRADSAKAAIEKADGIVNAWESPDAEWIGEELPDVIGC